MYLNYSLFFFYYSFEYSFIINQPSNSAENFAVPQIYAPLPSFSIRPLTPNQPHSTSTSSSSSPSPSPINVPSPSSPYAHLTPTQLQNRMVYDSIMGSQSGNNVSFGRPASPSSGSIDEGSFNLSSIESFYENYYFYAGKQVCY